MAGAAFGGLLRASPWLANKSVMGFPLGTWLAAGPFSVIIVCQGFAAPVGLLAIAWSREAGVSEINNAGRLLALLVAFAAAPAVAEEFDMGFAREIERA